MENNGAAAIRSREKLDVKKLTVLAMFIALGYITLFVFRIKVSFLTMEFKDVFTTMAGFVYGPIAAACVAFIEALLELLTVSSTGFWGALMNFAGSAAFAVTASLIYKYNKNFKGAVIGLVTSVFTMTVVMLIMNLLVTPIYAHTDVNTVIGMIPTLLLPFNLVKSILNAAVTFMLYKPLTTALRSIKILPKEDGFTVNKKSIAGIIVAAVIAILAVAVFIFLMNGSFELYKQG